MPAQKIKIVLTIAGSDSGAGAGIQSDIKTFYNIGVYGVTAITSVTSQNTTGIKSAFELPENVIYNQIETILEDFKIAAVKTGMLSSQRVIHAVANSISVRNLKIVVDPVISSKNKFTTLTKKGVDVLKEKLLPIAYLITPNLEEIKIFSGVKIKNVDDLYKAAQIIRDLGVENVLLKGGHFTGIKGIEPAADILFNGKDFIDFKGEYIKTRNTHGTGCVYSAAIAAYIAKGYKLEEAIKSAKEYLTAQLKKTVKIGEGASPVEQIRY